MTILMQRTADVTQIITNTTYFRFKGSKLIDRKPFKVENIKGKWVPVVVHSLLKTKHKRHNPLLPSYMEYAKYTDYDKIEKVTDLTGKKEYFAQLHRELGISLVIETDEYWQGFSLKTISK